MTANGDRDETASEVSVDRENRAPKTDTSPKYDDMDVKDPYVDDEGYDPSGDSKKKVVEKDGQGREKIRVNIGGGARRTVNTESMNAEQFDRFKSSVKARKSESGGAEDNDIDIQHLSELLHSGEAKHDSLEEQKMIHSEMRQQILRLTSIMGFQTVVIFTLVIIVAWLFKDQFVENGTLVDGDGNVLKVGSSDFSINGGLMASNDGSPMSTQSYVQKVSVTESAAEALRRVLAVSDATTEARQTLRRRLERAETRRLAMVEEDQPAGVIAAWHRRELQDSIWDVCEGLVNAVAHCGHPALTLAKLPVDSVQELKLLKNGDVKQDVDACTQAHCSMFDTHENPPAMCRYFNQGKNGCSKLTVKYWDDMDYMGMTFTLVTIESQNSVSPAQMVIQNMASQVLGVALGDSAMQMAPRKGNSVDNGYVNCGMAAGNPGEGCYVKIGCTDVKDRLVEIMDNYYNVVRTPNSDPVEAPAALQAWFDTWMWGQSSTRQLALSFGSKDVHEDLQPHIRRLGAADFHAARHTAGIRRALERAGSDEAINAEFHAQMAAFGFEEDTTSNKYATPQTPGRRLGTPMEPEEWSVMCGHRDRGGAYGCYAGAWDFAANNGAGAPDLSGALQDVDQACHPSSAMAGAPPGRRYWWDSGKCVCNQGGESWTNADALSGTAIAEDSWSMYDENGNDVGGWWALANLDTGIDLTDDSAVYVGKSNLFYTCWMKPDCGCCGFNVMAGNLC